MTLADMSSDEKIAILLEAMRDYRANRLEKDAFVVVCCNIIDPLPVTASSLKWAALRLEELRRGAGEESE